MDSGPASDPDEPEDGRKDINPSNLRGNADAPQSLKGRRDDKRNVGGIVIDEVAVSPFPMTPQSLPMIASKDDDGVIAQAVLLQPSDTPSDLFVHESDFAVVPAD